MVNSIYNTNTANAGKFPGSGRWPVVNAGTNLHHGGAGAVLVMNCEEKFQL